MPKAEGSNRGAGSGVSEDTSCEVHACAQGYPRKNTLPRGGAVALSWELPRETRYSV